MANLMDNQWGMVKESTYNTPVTVTRFYPWLDDVKSNWNPRRREGMGLFTSSNRTRRGDRSFLPIGQGEVTVKAELASRQAGVLLDACAGVSTVTAITGGSQQNFTPGISGVLLNSYTIQVGKVRNDGTVDAETYAGCTAKTAEIECPEDGVITITVVFDARSFSTATGLATQSITAGAFLFDHSQGAGGLGGTLTVPTTTALATGLTAYGNWRSWKLAWDNTADDGRWVLGGRNQPTIAELKATFGGSYEYNDLTIRTAYLAGTSLPATVTHTTAEVLGAGNSQLQVAIPQLFLPAGIPDAAESTVTHEVSGDIRFNGTNQPFYIVQRTADTVL